MKQNPIDYIGQALSIAEGITDIVEKALPTEAERKARFEVNKVKKIARAALKADKLTYRRVKLRIDACLVGLDIAKKEGLDLDKLRANLQKLVDSLGELQVN